MSVSNSCHWIYLASIHYASGKINDPSFISLLLYSVNLYSQTQWIVQKQTNVLRAAWFNFPAKTQALLLLLKMFWLHVFGGWIISHIRCLGFASSAMCTYVQQKYVTRPAISQAQGFIEIFCRGGWSIALLYKGGEQGGSQAVQHCH